MNTTRVQWVVVSDWHLGRLEANSVAILQMLQMYVCDTLILLGDIFDHLEFDAINDEHFSLDDIALLQYVRDLSENGVKVILVEGNHDSGLSQHQAVKKFFGSAVFVEDWMVLHLNDRDYLFTHGHRWHDPMSSDCWWVRLLGGGERLVRIADRYLGYAGFDQPFYFYIKKVPPWKGLWLAQAKELAQKAWHFALGLKLTKKSKLAMIACAHVHEPALVSMGEGLVYANTGSWNGSFSDATLVFDEKGPRVQLFDIRKGRIVPGKTICL